MKKFMVLYFAPLGAMEKMANATPEEMKKGMEPWMAWYEKCGSGIVDMGLPLANAKKVTKGGSVSSSDSKIAGYSIVQAENMDDAIDMVKDHPHLDWVEGSEVEVHEMLPMPGM